MGHRDRRGRPVHLKKKDKQVESTEQPTSTSSVSEKESEMGRVLKGKEDKPEFFAKGGDTKMFGKGTAHKALPDISGKESNSGEEGEVAKNIGPPEKYTSGFRMSEGGGSNKMFGKGHAGKKVPGISGKADQNG